MSVTAGSISPPPESVEFDIDDDSRSVSVTPGNPPRADGEEKPSSSSTGADQVTSSIDAEQQYRPPAGGPVLLGLVAAIVIISAAILQILNALDVDSCNPSEVTQRLRTGTWATLGLLMTQFLLLLVASACYGRLRKRNYLSKRKKKSPTDSEQASNAEPGTSQVRSASFDTPMRNPLSRTATTGVGTSLVDHRHNSGTTGSPGSLFGEKRFSSASIPSEKVNGQPPHGLIKMPPADDPTTDEVQMRTPDATAERLSAAATPTTASDVDTVSQGTIAFIRFHNEADNAHSIKSLEWQQLSTGFSIVRRLIGELNSRIATFRGDVHAHFEADGVLLHSRRPPSFMLNLCAAMYKQLSEAYVNNPASNLVFEGDWPFYIAVCHGFLAEQYLKDGTHHPVGDLLEQVRGLALLAEIDRSNFVCNTAFANEVMGEDSPFGQSPNEMHVSDTFKPEKSSGAFSSTMPPGGSAAMIERALLPDVTFHCRPIDVVRRAVHSLHQSPRSAGAASLSPSASFSKPMGSDSKSPSMALPNFGQFTISTKQGNPKETVLEVMVFALPSEGRLALALPPPTEAFGVYDEFFQAFLLGERSMAEALAAEFMKTYPNCRQVPRLLHYLTHVRPTKPHLMTRIPYFRNERKRWEVFTESQGANASPRESAFAAPGMGSTSIMPQQKPSSLRRGQSLMVSMRKGHTDQLTNQVQLAMAMRQQMSLAVNPLLDDNDSLFGDDEISVSSHQGLLSRKESVEGPPAHLKDTDGHGWRRSPTILGQGMSGVVYLGLREGDGKMAAIKAVPLDQFHGNDAKLQSLQAEVAVLSRLRHKNLVDYLGFSVTQKHVCLFMEYISGGSLSTLVDAFGGLPETTCIRYARDLAQGLHYLHSKGVIHRDMKPQNVLVTLDGVCKISDFGTVVSANNLLTTTTSAVFDGNASLQDDLAKQAEGIVAGSPLFMAPEQARAEAVQQSDVWGLGMIVHYVFTGQLPYDDEQLYLPPLTFLYRLGSDAEFRPKIKAEGMPVKLVAFLRQCFASNPEERATAQQLLTDPWIKPTSATTPTTSPRLARREKRANSAGPGKHNTSGSGGSSGVEGTSFSTDQFAHVVV